MTDPRAHLQSQLDTLKNQLPDLVREHPDEGEFWSAFAGASDFILDAAGPDDDAWVWAQIQALLAAHGKAAPRRSQVS